MSSQYRRYGIEHREFLAYVAAVSAIPQVPLHADNAAQTPVKFQDYPFQLGVASGDPQHDGVVIWTRIGLKPLAGDAMLMDALLVINRIANPYRFASNASKREAIDRIISC